MYDTLKGKQKGLNRGQRDVKRGWLAVSNVLDRGDNALGQDCDTLVGGVEAWNTGG